MIQPMTFEEFNKFPPAAHGNACVMEYAACSIRARLAWDAAQTAILEANAALTAENQRLRADLDAIRAACEPVIVILESRVWTRKHDAVRCLAALLAWKDNSAVGPPEEP